MVSLIYNPQWFYGKDILIDAVSIIVLGLIASFSVRYYKLERKNKNYLYLSVSFLLIAFSFIFKIIANFTIYYHVFETKTIGLYTITYQTVTASGILFFAGYLIYRLLSVLGLYLLYSIYQKNQPKSNIFLIVFFILISTYSSQSAYYIFHLTSFVFLSLLTIQYYSNYKKNKQLTSKLLANSFAVIAASQIFFMFAGFNTNLYVVAEIIQLVGYLILLETFIKVQRNAKKKR